MTLLNQRLFVFSNTLRLYYSAYDLRYQTLWASAMGSPGEWEQTPIFAETLVSPPLTTCMPQLSLQTPALTLQHRNPASLPLEPKQLLYWTQQLDGASPPWETNSHPKTRVTAMVTVGEEAYSNVPRKTCQFIKTGHFLMSVKKINSIPPFQIPSAPSFTSHLS